MRWLLYLMPAVLFSQVHVSFAQQGAEGLRTTAGKLPKGIGLGSVEVCNRSSQDIVRPAGAVYDGIRLFKVPGWKPVSTIAADLAGQILDRTVKKSTWALIADIATLAASGAGLAGQSKAITMSTQLADGLAFAPTGNTLLQAFLGPRLPNDATVKANLLQGDLGIHGSSCVEPAKYFLYIYRGAWDPQEFTIP